MTAKLFLEGVRVIELSVAWAGPVCGMILAGFGAEVIKIEPPSRPDTSRGRISPPPGGVAHYPNGDPGERPWNRAGSFNERHRSKLSLTLDLVAERGKSIFKQLVAVSDVVVVNYRAAMMDNLGLDYSALKEVNPQLIMILMPGFGVKGMYKNYSAYGSTMEAVSGAAYLSGFPDGEPLVTGFTWPDPASGTLAAGAILGALLHRCRTGEGMLVELSQMNVAIRALGGPLMDYSMNSRVQSRMGNRHPFMAPHGCYPCLGEDQWITIAVSSDEEWKAMCELFGATELVGDGRFADSISRWKNQDELDEVVAQWTRTYDKWEATRLLQGAGVPAGPVLAHWEHLSDPHFADRGFFEEVRHPEAGTYPLRRQVSFKLSKTPVETRRHAPLFGEHNSYILKGVLGLSDEEIEELAEQKVISDRPLADPPTAF